MNQAQATAPIELELVCETVRPGGLPAVAANQPLAVTPITLLQMAVQQNADLDRLEKLMDLQRQWEAEEARKAFNAAMAAFKANPPEILKNKHVSFEARDGGSITSYDHATLDEVCAKVGIALAEHGLYHDWSIEQKDGGVSVTCTLTHEKGHSKSVTMTALPDTSGKKNSIQAIASTTSYLQRYTLRAVSGTAEKGMDDDGRSAEGEIGMPKADIAMWIQSIRECTTADKAKVIWHSAVKACEIVDSGNGDRAACQQIKDAYVAHLEFIKKAEKETAQ